MVIAAAVCIAFVAGILRGLTGFGFALLAVIGFGQFWPPEIVTPLVLLVEIALGALLMGDGVLAHVEPRRVAALVGGSVIGIICGTLASAALPLALMKPALDTAVLISAAMSLVNVRAPALDRPWVGALVGFVVGGLVAAFAVGGPFAVVWLLAIALPPAVIRADLIVYFGLIDIVAVVTRAVSVGIPRETFFHAALILPTAFAGALLGGRLFRRIDAIWWRRIAAYGILAAALASLGRTLIFAP